MLVDMADLYDEWGLMNLEARTRFEIAKKKYFDELEPADEGKGDESVRYDCLLVMQRTVEEVRDTDPKLFDEIGELFGSMLLTDPSGFVRHEAAFQLGYLDMYKQKDALKKAAIYDNNDIVRHEAVEGLGLLRNDDVGFFEWVIENDSSAGVKETAVIFVKRASRFEKANLDEVARKPTL